MNHLNLTSWSRRDVLRMLGAGVSDAVIRQITIDNPRRLLAFIPKRS